jgi:YjbE family integral membrane protein
VTVEFWTRLLGIIVINLALAGDNAIVIAMAVRSLPAERRFWALMFGTAAAVVLRLVFIAAATYLLRIPLLEAVGAVLLVWIALKLVREEQGGDEAGGHEVNSAMSLYQAVWVILVADTVMSLDNVLAVAGAAAGELFLVALGIGLSIPLVIWGAALLSALMDRHPWLIWLGGGILGYVAMEMFLRDAIIAPRITVRLSPVTQHVLPYGLGGVIVAIAWWSHRVRARTPAHDV